MWSRAHSRNDASVMYKIRIMSFSYLLIACFFIVCTICISGKISDIRDILHQQTDTELVILLNSSDRIKYNTTFYGFYAFVEKIDAEVIFVDRNTSSILQDIYIEYPIAIYNRTEFPYTGFGDIRAGKCYRVFGNYKNGNSAANRDILEIYPVYGNFLVENCRYYLLKDYFGMNRKKVDKNRTKTEENKIKTESNKDINRNKEEPKKAAIRTNLVRITKTPEKKVSKNNFGLYGVILILLITSVSISLLLFRLKIIKTVVAEEDLADDSERDEDYDEASLEDAFGV